ncbi:Uncharacterized protein SCF082_LOCUS33439, partial [Durusdinium trenchii]
AKKDLDPVIKKQKTEWSAALRKLPGEVLEYLSNFVEGPDGAELPHPCQMVVDVFQDESTASLTLDKLYTFLEESNKAQGKRFAASPNPDLSTLTPGQYLTCSVHIKDIKICLPPDGLPCVNDWITTVLSFLFSGSRLRREPIDLYVLKPEAADGQPRLGIKKGFTRLSSALFLAQVVSDLDPVAAKIFGIPSSISSFQDAETISFDAMQLSTQGAERQRKGVMKMAMRFEALLHEKKAAGGMSDKSDRDIIQEVIGRYNDHRANVEPAMISKMRNAFMNGLSVPQVDEVSNWALRTLQLNPDCSMVLIICPMLAGEGVLNGLRGAFRRIEDKLDSLNLEMKQVSVLFDVSSTHGNRNFGKISRLKNFDNVFAPVTNGEAGAPAPMVTSKTSADLDNQIPLVSETFCEPPPSLTSEEFQSKRPTLVATVTLSMGINVTCSVADDKVYITSASKAKDFLTKDGNENKAIEFRLDSQDDIALCQN